MSHFSFTQTHTYKRKVVPSPIGDIVQLYFYIFCFVSICLSNKKERHRSMLNVVKRSCLKNTKFVHFQTTNPEVEGEVENCSSLLSPGYLLRDPAKMYCLKD
jgi:hypothetical protein